MLGLVGLLVTASLFALRPVFAATVTWLPDVVTYAASSVDLSGLTAGFVVSFRSSAPFYSLDQNSGDGHFKVDISMTQGSVSLSATTACIAAYATVSDMEMALSATQIQYHATKLPLGPVSGYFDVRVVKYQNVSLPSAPIEHAFRVELTRQTQSSSPIVVTFAQSVTTDCAVPLTVGSWGDGTRWSGGVVPTASDTVVVPAGAGVITLTTDVTIAALTMFSGIIVAHDSQCSPGWTASLYGSKCWRLVDEARTFADAEQQCNAYQGPGSADRHLAHIRDRTELEETIGLCRGYSSSSLAKASGCWIGLTDRYGNGSFDWIAPQAIGGDDILFLDWRRFEPNNHTVSHSVETHGGERCASLFPGQQDALIQEQGAWIDDSCLFARPYICQEYKVTQRYSLSVTGVTAISGGEFVGGTLQLLSQSTTTATSISSLVIARTGTLVINQGAATVANIGHLGLEDGSRLMANSAVVVGDHSFIGEAQVATTASPPAAKGQPRVYLSTSASLTVSCASWCNATVNARVLWRGEVKISAMAKLNLLQGGDLSQSKINFPKSGSGSLILDGYAGMLATYDAFELQASNRGPFVREYRGANESAELSSIPRGLYKLSVQNLAGTVQATKCIPYNATADELADLLDLLPLVSTRGGAVVRRYGDDQSTRFGFGFTYRIELNRHSTNDFANGELTLSVQCYGQSCGCAEALVPMVGPTGLAACSRGHPQANYSITNPSLCNIPPSLTLTRLSIQSQTNTSGSGSILVQSGTYRLPPVAYASLGVQGSGTAIVAADRVQWHRLQAQDVGQLIVTGHGWSGWDSAELLYAPHWTDRRGLVDYLQAAPSTVLTATEFFLNGLGAVFIAAPDANLTWIRGAWDGGMIGGLASIQITESLSMNGTGKALKYGVTMTVAPTAAAIWTSGNISLANGAHLVVQGNLTISNALTASTLAYPMAMGEARFLTSLTDSAVLLTEEEGRNPQTYFSLDLAPALRPGWYANPLCDPRCFDTNTLEITHSGGLVSQPSSVVTFLLPVNLVGKSRLRVGTSASVELASGGTCGNFVVVDLSPKTTLTLSGGQMEMEATCTIQGAGELRVVAGSHSLAFSIDAHITIAGGALVWPESRGVQKSITLNGGLLLEGTGVLEVQPFSTTITVSKPVQLTGSCLIQFPLIGIAAQASPFDSADAPDTSPRGNFIALNGMIWEGGTLKGKADFTIQQELYLDGGTKYIESLAKLVNRGHCEWGAGDIQAADNGDFQNFGTVQMRMGGEEFASNALYKGAALPIENGGDVFALDFHSWDTDLGALNTTEYVRLTAQLVSRVPNGWTEADQR